MLYIYLINRKMIGQNQMNRMNKVFTSKYCYPIRITYLYGYMGIIFADFLERSRQEGGNRYDYC